MLFLARLGAAILALMAGTAAPFSSFVAAVDAIDRGARWSDERVVVQADSSNLAASALYTDLLAGQPLQFLAQTRVARSEIIPEALQFYLRTGDFRRAAGLRHCTMHVPDDFALAELAKSDYSKAVSCAIHLADYYDWRRHENKGLEILQDAETWTEPAAVNWERAQLFAELWFRDRSELHWKQLGDELFKLEVLKAGAWVRDPLGDAKRAENQQMRLYDLAVLYRADDQPKKAEALLQRILQQDIAEPLMRGRILGELALNQVLLGHDKNADATLRRASEEGVALQYDFTRKVLKIALAYDRDGKRKKAIDVLRPEVSAGGWTSRTWVDASTEGLLLAQLLQKEHRFQEAENVLTKVSNYSSERTELEYELAGLRKSKHQYEEAFSDYILAAQNPKYLNFNCWPALACALDLMERVPSLQNQQALLAVARVVERQRGGLDVEDNAEVLQRILTLATVLPLPKKQMLNLQERYARKLNDTHSALLLESIAAQLDCAEATLDDKGRAQALYMESARMRISAGEPEPAATDVRKSLAVVRAAGSIASLQQCCLFTQFFHMHRSDIVEALLQERSAESDYPSIWLLANLYVLQKRFDDAERTLDIAFQPELMQSALRSEETQKDVIDEAVGISKLLSGCNRTADARRLLDRLVAMMHHYSGPMNPKLIALLKEQASLCERDGDKPAERAALKERAHVWEGVYGLERPLLPDGAPYSEVQTEPESLKKYDPTCTMGWDHIPDPPYKDLDEAALLQWLAADEKEHGWASLVAIESRRRLARFYRKEGRYGDCERMLKRQIAVAEQLEGASSIWRGMFMLDLAQLCAEQQDWKRALEWIRAAQAADSQLGTPEVRWARCIRYAGLLAYVGQVAEADEYMKLAYQARDRRFGGTGDPWFWQHSEDLNQVLVSASGAQVDAVRQELALHKQKQLELQVASIARPEDVVPIRYQPLSASR